MPQPAQKLISTILKHDAKVTSYKIALLRAINDIALSYLDLRSLNKSIAIPLRLLAEYWVAYYRPFVDPDEPILQGGHAKGRPAHHPDAHPLHRPRGMGRL